jgi:hypothetical protein
MQGSDNEAVPILRMGGLIPPLTERSAVTSDDRADIAPCSAEFKIPFCVVTHTSAIRRALLIHIIAHSD